MSYHPAVLRDPENLFLLSTNWIPTFVGMTKKKIRDDKKENFGCQKSVL